LAFLPENPLEDVLARAMTEPLARPQFYKLLVDSPLVILGRIGGAQNDQLTIPTLRHNGREYLPIFSGLTRLEAFGAEQEHFTIGARQLFETTRGANFVLNPNSECGKMLMASEIAYWLDPSARARRQLRAAAIRLSVPERPPAKLLHALPILFRNRSAVIAAHLLEAANLDISEPPHPLIGIETAAGSWQKIAGEVSELAAAVAPEIILDVVQIDHAAPPESLSAQLAGTPPFYRRNPN
jgi:SseB protein N-terminal domain/SseB protein C-terminal domain